MLVGREAETREIRLVLETARAGRSGVLIVRGESGIGKSSLLAWAADHAADAQALTMRGLESESELPFAGLHELLRPVLPLLDAIPEPQAEALRGALLLGGDAQVDRFAASAGVLSMLVSAAERQPLLVLVDDAQWVDEATVDALVFAVRRLGSENVAVLVAHRDGASPFSALNALEIEVAPLARNDAATVVREAAAGDVREEVVLRIIDAAAGNPLALLEVTKTLGPAQLTGRTPLQELLPAGRAVEAAFARRLAGLAADARKAALVAAASDDNDVVPVAAAMDLLGIGLEALTAAEAAGVVAIEDGRFHFTHPLIRSVVYGGTSTDQRREAHAALARVVEHDGSRAWHRAAAAVAPDEAIASALEAAAEGFLRRGGYLAAARALERAVRVTPGEEDRAGRLLAAGEAARRAGRGAWARELLEEARELARDDALVADIELRAATLEAWSGSQDAARRQYVRQADRLAEADPDRAAAALGYATALAVVGGDMPAAVRDGRRAVELASPEAVSAQTRRLTLETLGGALLLTGARDEARHLLFDAIDLAEREHVSAGIDYLAGCLVWLEEYERARALVEPLIADARAAGDLRTLTAALNVAADLDYRVGDWAAAFATASESLRLAEETAQHVQVAYSAAVLATVEAARGREEECRRHVEVATTIGRQHGLTVMTEYSGAALGLLELGRDEPALALEHLEVAARSALDAGRDEPAVVQWAPDLIEAYVQAAREEDAERGLETFERQAARTEHGWANAAAARCRALLVDAADIDSAFGLALDLHGRAIAPFEHARTELCYGQRLRRERRRVEARAQLRSALARFERLDAAPWAATAKRELAASGERLRTRNGAGRDELTAQELQIALTVAKGATNKEAAASLFLSPKTIESHLSSVYRKLGVRSRAQMINRLQAQQHVG